MRRGVIYVRQSCNKKSSKNQHRAAPVTVSPEVQEEKCRDLAEIRACDVVDVIRDLDRSGAKVASRPGFQRILDGIEAAPPDVIAVYDQSRTFRNTTEAIAFYALMERLAQVKVAFHKGHMDRSAVGEFSYTTLAAAHTMERKMTGEKTRDTYGYLNARGFATGAAPYGYRRADDGGMVPVEEQAGVVRRLFEEYATGRWSCRDLAERLNVEGVPREDGRSETGGWMGDTISAMLRNVAYVGKTYTVSRERREGDLIAATWSAIVEAETFDAVQRVMDRYKNAGRGGGRPKEYLFAGLLVCRHCWRRMHARSTTAAAYYRCRRDLADGERCEEGARSIREDTLLPWAEVLMERLAAIQPMGFRAALEGGQR